MTTPLPMGAPTHVDTLVTVDGFIGGIAVDQRNLYYTVMSPVGAVYRVPLAGGSPTRLAELPSPRGIAVVGDDLYVAADGVRRVSINGGVANIVVGNSSCFDVASDGAAAYVTCPGTFGNDGTRSPASATPDGKILRVDRSGSRVVAENLDHPYAVAASGGVVYATLKNRAPAALIAVDAGGSVRTLAKLGNPNGLAIGNDGGVYVADQNGVTRVATNGATTQLAANFAAPAWVAFDGRAIFASDGVVGDQGGIWRFDGTAATKIASLPSAGRLAMAGGSLYAISATVDKQRIVRLAW